MSSVNCPDGITSTLINTGSLTPGWMNNLGITYAAGVFKITGADGTALSSVNPAWITVKSTASGKIVTLKATVDSSFNDDAHASSSLTNMGWGIIETVDWANDRPFFLYVVNKGNTNIDGADGSSTFFISDVWNLSTTPAAANSIGDLSAIPITDAQGSILIMDTVTVADYVSLPCQLIGAFRMRWSTATDDWTVQALGNTDGLGESALDATFATEWTMPVGQNGAEAGKHFTTADGATALTFSPDNYMNYILNKNGNFKVRGYFLTQSANGADGTSLRVFAPYKNVSTRDSVGPAYCTLNNIQYVGTSFLATGMYYIRFVANNTEIADNLFANTNDYLIFEIEGNI